ncbi:MAG: efflux RND transporter periplasmic adaptor subunit [Ectothiorhodospiraceae bacterium AqS1]|nr:efflux RND transporter periplasmic adaptor subunit [Ectothiorhodospiraceae bacterium AqS1]
MSLLKQFIWLIALALLAGGGYFAWQHLIDTDTAGAAGAQQMRGGGPGRGGAGRAGGPAVEVESVRFSDIENIVEAVGTTRAVRAVEIAPTAAGRVREIGFRAGERIEQGELLLRLDDDIERANLEEAKARLVDARATLERARALRRTSATSESVIGNLVAELATAQANHDRAQRRLQERSVVAPFAGIVGLTELERGARVAGGETITTLDDLTSVEVSFSLPERLYGRIGPGMRIKARAGAFPERIFEGEIALIDTRIDPASRAFQSRAVIANPDLLLPAGMFMHLSIVLDRRRGLVIPEESVVVEGSQAHVFVVESVDERSLVRRRNVILGQRSFGEVEILDGLTEGEAVIVRGVQKVRDGRGVRIAKPRPKAGKAEEGGS